MKIKTGGKTLHIPRSWGRNEFSMPAGVAAAGGDGKARRVVRSLGQASKEL